MLTFFSLAAATLLSEDLTCITAGLLIQQGAIGAAAGVAACTLGIFAGDVGLWAVGRLGGRAVVRWPWLARRIGNAGMETLRSWIADHAGQAILASRFLPGTRLPLYVVAGLAGLPGLVFARWALLATVLWTPAFVMLTAVFGDTFVRGVSPVIGSAWVANLGAAAIVLGILTTFRSVAGRRA